MKKRSYRLMAILLMITLVVQPLAVAAEENMTVENDIIADHTKELDENEDKTMTATKVTPTTEELIANDYVLYFVNCGAQIVDQVEAQDRLGLYQSITDKEFSLDTTGYTWGRRPSDPNSNPVSGGTKTSLNKEATYYYMGSSTYVSGTSGFYYDFELPEGNYEVTVGFKNPWSHRTVDVVLEGTTYTSALSLDQNTLRESKNELSVSDGQLNVFVHNPSRKDAYTDPIINYIIIKAVIPSDTTTLVTKIHLIEQALAAAAASGINYAREPLGELYLDAAGKVDNLNSMDALLLEARAMVDAGGGSPEDIKEKCDQLDLAFQSLRIIETYASFSGTEGAVWKDMNGVPIQAHGGQVQRMNGKWWWYGEDKTKGYRSNGISAYSSDDLYNWTFEGYVMRTVATREQLDSDEYFKNLYAEYTPEQKDRVFLCINNSTSVIERPKLIYNETTKKYVMWFHADGPTETSTANYAAASAGVAVSDSPTGPFRFIDRYRLNVAPEDQLTGAWYESSKGFARDMNLFVDEDGTAYIIYSSEENMTMFISKLNAEYTYLATPIEEAVHGVDFVRLFPGAQREAPALFKYQGKYYLITSGATGWDPNQARYWMADSILGNWTNMGDPCVGDDTNKTFQSQSTNVFPYDLEKGLFIFMGDRWFSSNLGDSRYIWLPVEIGHDKTIKLSNYRDWDLADLEALYPIQVNSPMQELYYSVDELPKTLNVRVYENGLAVNKEMTVVWDTQNVIPTVLTTIAGTLVDLNRKVSTKLLQIPSDLQYYIDSGATAGSDIYDIINSKVTLKNTDACDKAYTQGSWGYSSVLAGTGVQNPDMGIKNPTSRDCFETGFWAYTDKKIEYVLPLEAGSYQLYAGFQEWWATNRNIGISIAYSEEGNTVTKTLGTFANNGKKTVNYSFDLPLDTEVKITIYEATPGPDIILSWLAVGKASDHDLIEAKNLALDEFEDYTAKLIVRKVNYTLEETAALNAKIDEGKGLIQDATTVAFVEDALAQAKNAFYAVYENAGVLVAEPIVKYTFDEALVNKVIADHSNSGNAGALFGNAAYVQDEVKGQVLYLDGTNGTYGELPAGLFDHKDELTIAMDVKSNLTSGNFFTFAIGKNNNQYLFTRVRGTEIYGAITKSTWSGEQKLNASITAGEWAKVILVLSEEKLTLYINGVKANEISGLTTKISDFGSNVLSYLGKSFYSGDRYYSGYFDNIEIYDKAFTQKELEAILGIEPQEPGGGEAKVLVNYDMTLRDGKITDLSEYHKDGIVTNPGGAIAKEINGIPVLELSGGVNGGYITIPEGTVVKNVTEVTVSMLVRITENRPGTWMWCLGTDQSKYLYLTGCSSAGQGSVLRAGTGMDFSNQGKGWSNERVVVGTSALDTNVWQNVVLTYKDNGSIAIYRNGVLMGTTVADPAYTLQDLLTAGDSLDGKVGGSLYGVDPTFAGLVAEFKIYDKAFTEEEVAKIQEEMEEKMNKLEILTDEDKIAQDKNNLVIYNAGDIRGNITLPAIGKHGSAITWASDQEAVISSKPIGSKPAGVVVRPKDADSLVKLMATLTLGSLSVTKEFTVTVKRAVEKKPTENYLFAYFTGESANGEQVYFAASEDALHWSKLNDNNPILTSALGELGVRDPHIIRSAEGDKFYLIATDLSIYRNGDWGRAQTAGSKSIMVWESLDMVNWSNQRMVKVALDTAGCTWAPESFYDDTTGEYIVFWASKTLVDNYSRQRIYYSKTRDFYSFTAPLLWLELPEGTCIDSSVIRDEGTGLYYRFTKNEGTKKIFMEQSESLLGTWSAVTSASLNAQNGVEGPTSFKLNGENKWILLLDAYSSGGYYPLVTEDLASGVFTRLNSTDYSFVGSPRHGTVLPITAEEYHNIMMKWNQEYAEEHGNVGPTTKVTVSPMNASTFNGGEFEGWGTSFCWWPNRLGYSDVLAEKAAEAFYNKHTGLGLNIIRYNIGGGDDPTHNHITRTDSEVPGYGVFESYDAQTGEHHWSYDWTADYNQRNVLFKAIEECGDEVIVEAFSNSPPYFMTNSGCSSGAEDAGKNNLREDAYDDFARYLAEVAKYFKDNFGVTFQSLAPMNEPYTNYWGAYSNKQEGCHFDQGDSMSKLIKELYQELKARGLEDIIISGTDETSIDTQITSYLKLSPEAKEILSRIDVHTYGGSNRAGMKALAEQENKNLWMSEVDGGSTAGTNAGEMGAGLWLAQRIITDMNGMTPSAWILWQVIDNHISQDGYDGKQDSGMVNLNGGYWGTAVANHDRSEIILTMKYYTFGQFTRYIRPGYTIIASTANTLVAYDKMSKQLVIVATNTKAENQRYDFDLSQFRAIGDSVRAIRTSGTVENGEKWAELAPIPTYETGFFATLKANSVTTFIVEGVELQEKPMREIRLLPSMVTGSAPWNNNKANGPQNTVDGNISTFFDGVGNGFVQIDLGSNYLLEAIAYAPRSGFASRCVDASFYGSKDGESWTLIHTITAAPGESYNFVFAKDFLNREGFRYIKYSVPSANHNCNIAEIKLFGIPEDIIGAHITPSATVFDKNRENQSDVTVNITWNDASAVMDVKNNGITIGSTVYAVSGSALTIKKEFLATQDTGDMVFTVEFDRGEAAVFTTTILDTTVVGAVIDPLTGSFDKNIEKQADVTTNITWNDASKIIGIKKNGELIPEAAYEVSGVTAVSGSALSVSQGALTVGGSTPSVSGSGLMESDENTAVNDGNLAESGSVFELYNGVSAVSGSALTIKKEFLASLDTGTLPFTIVFDRGNAAVFTIQIFDTTQPVIVSAILTPPMGSFDKNASKQADVSTTITWNDASLVTHVHNREQQLREGIDYLIQGNTLYITKEYLSTQPEGALLFSIGFDQGEAAEFIIVITKTPEIPDPILSAVINPSNVEFDRYYPYSTDVGTIITWNDAKRVTDVKVSGSSLGADAYSVIGNRMVIKKYYLSGLGLGYHTFIIELDVGNAASLIVRVKDTTPEIPPTPVTPTPEPTPEIVPQPKPMASDQTDLVGVSGAATLYMYKPDETGRMKVTIELPVEELLKEIAREDGSEEPSMITVPISSEKLMELMEKDEVKYVDVEVTVPSILSPDDEVIMSIHLTKEILQTAKDKKKNIRISVVDEVGRESYSWSFTGEDLANSNRNMTDVNLSLKVEEIGDIADLNQLLSGEEEKKGLVVSFSHDGLLPAQAQVRIYVGNKEGIKPGDIIYLYHYNQSTGKLDTLPYSSNYIVDKDGYITIDILHCSDYVMLTKETKSSRITSLRDQIKISPARSTLYIGGTTGATTNIKIELPATLEFVKDFKEQTRSSAIGAVTVTYKSSNEAVATVDSNGLVTVKKVGTAQITTVITLYSGKTKTQFTMITVKEPYIKLTKSTSKMKVNEIFTFEVEAYGVRIEDIVWTTAAKSVVVINKKTGMAVAKSKGTDIVIATAGNIVMKEKVVVK